jgi:hypothetical protein
VAVESWLCLGGIELTSSCRSSVYAANGFRPYGVEINACGCCGTPDQWAAAMEDAPYTNPTADDAPWYSASEPNSGDFGGFMVTAIDGLGAGPITRSLTKRANGRGSFLGPAIQDSPTITVTGVLFGKTCCSVDYGLRWLGTVLQGSCGADCNGDELSFLDCCPTFGATPFADLTPHLRYLEGVQLVASPKIVQKYGSCCGSCNGTTYMQIQFQLAATAPCVYRDPVTVADEQPFDAVDPTDCDITWVVLADGQECPDDSCPDPIDCTVDPSCAALPAPPKAPVPFNPCICTSFNTRRVVVEIPAGTIPEFTEGLPVAVVKSGSNEMRQVRVRFWLANDGETIDDLDDCDTCGEVTLSRIPASSSFTFDAKHRRSTIQCPGAAITDATPLMGSAGGRLPIEWPEIACAGARFLMSVEADSDSVALDASVSLDIVAAECYGSVA